MFRFIPYFSLSHFYFLILAIWFPLETLPLYICILTILTSNPKWFHLQWCLVKIRFQSPLQLRAVTSNRTHSRMRGVPQVERSYSFSKHWNGSLLVKMKGVILQLRVSLGSQCLPNVSDPDRNRINGSDLLGTYRQQHCTDKPSQDVHDPAFAQDRGPHVISDFLSSPDFCGIFCGFLDKCHHFPSFLPGSFLSPA